MRKISASLLAVVFIIMSVTGCTPSKILTEAKEAASEGLDYSDGSLWIYNRDASSEGLEADCFMIGPSVYTANGGDYNMPTYDASALISYKSTLSMEKDIYSGTCVLYAPVYRQVSLEVYDMPADEAEKYFEIAYGDVRDAFLYYLQNDNNGRPLVIAGFSQGADMAIRLLKEFGDCPEVKNVLVACYAIGWRITEGDIKEAPYLKPAEGENDTGVIIAYDCESEEVTSSLVVPAGTRTYSINPLNWRTDSAVAGKELNLGACFADYSGGVTEITEFTGCYIDPVRGSLKVTDVPAEEYPPVLSMFSEGEYHIYDYQFFFRNLQENVAVRVSAFTGK